MLAKALDYLQPGRAEKALDAWIAWAGPQQNLWATAVR